MPVGHGHSLVKGKRCSAEQIIGILKKMESGKVVKTVCRDHGVSEQTVYWWRNMFGGMGVPEVRRLNEVEDENRRLKSIVADQVVDIQPLEEINSKKS